MSSNGELNKSKKIYKKNKIEKIDIVIFLSVIFIFSFVLLSFFPGLLTSDNVDQINQAMNNSYSNAHPIFHSFLIGNLTKLGGTSGIWVPALFQIIVFALIWTYACKAIRKYNDGFLNKMFQFFATIIICLIPINFLYAITLWKDILYSYSILLLLIFIYIGIKENYKYTIAQLVFIAIATVSIMKFRHNGVPIGFLMFIFLLIANFIKDRNLKKSIIFLISFILTFILMTIPQWLWEAKQNSDGGSILNTTRVYAMGALLNTDIKLEPEEEEFLDTILNVEEWKKSYDPYTGNAIFYNSDFNKTTLTTKKACDKFVIIFNKYAKQKPMVIIKHFLTTNSIWWSIPEQGSMHSIIVNNSSVSDMTGGIYSNHTLIKNGDVIITEHFINKSMESTFKYELFYRPATAILISLIAIIGVCIKKKNGSYLIILIPMILNIGTYVFLISSQDQRYFYPCFMTEYFSVLILANEYIKIKRTKKEKYKGEDETKPLIIIPAYNEGLNIEKTIKDVRENTSYDYIIINDCSRDNTMEICQKNDFNVISLPINYGLTSGIQIGMKYAYRNGYNIVIQFDGDGQHQAKYIKDLVEKIEKEKNDISIGSRYVTEKKPLTKRMLGSRLITFCIKATTGKRINDPTSGMRAYNKRAIKEFIDNQSLTPEPDTLVYMIRKGMRVTETQVTMKDREFGESYLKPLKATEYMFNMIFSILFIRSLTEKEEEEEN